MLSLLADMGYVLLSFALVFVPFENGVQWFMIIKRGRLLWNKQE